MTETRYALDADVFISAARSYYAFDLAPSFWEKLENCAKAGDILSVDHVKKDLDRGNDELKAWANKKILSLSNKTDSLEIAKAYSELITWVNGNNQYLPFAKAEFAKVSDGWLIAYAKTTSSVVVTNETFDPNIRRRVKIPNVCRAFDIQCVDTFTMMRNLGITLG